MTAILQRSMHSWQKQLAGIITEPGQLFELLQLDKTYLPAAIKASELFPLRVTHYFAERMEKGNINDPLLRQVLPLDEEFTKKTNFSNEPLQETSFNPLPGLLHKYHGRVLLIVSGACAINCRFCFRRSFAYEANNPSLKQWDKVIDYIANDPSIEEVIYSGGDPLVASDFYLRALTQKLEAISHLKLLRIHSRLPVVLPDRLSHEFTTWFARSKLQPSLVIHCNHPNELGPSLKTKLITLKKLGVNLFNQSVLLKGINDDPKTLVMLSKQLFDYGVIPYYLHLLDPIQGAAHFDLSLEAAKAIYTQMQAKLPGYLVPKLVAEIPGKQNKTLLS